MRISEDPFFGGAAWQAYAATKPWTLSAGYGTKTVYVQFRESSSDTQSNVFNDQIEYAESCDEEPPVTEVGGDIYPVNKLAVLAPWLALAAVLLAGTVMAARRYRARN